VFCLLFFFFFFVVCFCVFLCLFFCFCVYLFQFCSYRFFKIRNATLRLSEQELAAIVEKKKQKKKRDPRLVGLVIGQPLPDEGTCKHYSRSRRWFMFPCCQRAFPCDICHDENTADGHQSKLATKQYCGLCSRQISIQLKQCVCGNSFDSAAKHYWEGGKGARSKHQLSKNDKHKYAGLTKTVSAKRKSQDH
jgi:hypothetical protein